VIQQSRHRVTDDNGAVMDLESGLLMSKQGLQVGKGASGSQPSTSGADAADAGDGTVITHS